MPTIRTVTFDAGGTLFSPAESVGETYARLARQEGIELGPGALDVGFDVAFGLAPPLVAPVGSRGADLLAAERGWWRDVVRATLSHALAPSHPPAGPEPSQLAAGAEPLQLPAGAGAAQIRSSLDLARVLAEEAFERFFAAAFAHYAEPSAWRLHDDAAACLGEVAERGLRIGVVSNFDSRLHRLVAGLGLTRWVDFAVASTEVGFAKPEPEIFHAAARRLGVAPSACLHVGDSLSADALGAQRAGMRGVWLDRHDSADDALSAGVPRIRSLADLPRLLP